MAYNDRSLSIRYAPSPPPMGDDVSILSRATWDELSAVERSLTDLDRPNALSVDDQEDLDVTNAALWQTVLDENPVVNFEQPEGTFDPLTGIYTCAQEGFYQVIVVLSCAPFTTPAVKSYYLGARASITREGSISIKQASNGGNDDVPLQTTLVFFTAMRKSNTIFVEGTVVHEQQTGITPVSSSLQIIRVSGA